MREALWPAAVYFVLLMVSGSARASIAMEPNVDVELLKIANSSVSPVGSTSSPAESLGGPNSSTNDATRPIESDQILASEAASRPPIYRSAPKQIESAIGDLGKSAASQVANSEQAGNLIRRHHQDVAVGPEDLSTAAGHHKKKKHKKKKIIIVKKKKKRKKKKKKKKIIIVKKKKKKHHKKGKKKKIIIHYKPKHSHRVESKHYHHPHGGDYEGDENDGNYNHAAEEQRHHNHHQHKPKANHHHEHHHASAPAGKYYEYRSVPKKGAWKFGFKRGNKKHLIERKEHGHKSHFKTTFNWKDKKGKGEHLFDYNHGDYKKHHHVAAAVASHVPPKQIALPTSQVLAKANS